MYHQNRKNADIWTDEIVVQQLVAQLLWETNIVLMDKSSDQSERIWYAQKAFEFGWSRNVLAFQIEGQLHKLRKNLKKGCTDN